jgi:DNA protecting protein DprA
MDVREQACWLLLAFESGLTTRIANTIFALWCSDQGRTLDDFFSADVQEWHSVCHLNRKIIEKVEQARSRLSAQIVLAEQLQREKIGMLTALDAAYPERLKTSLTLSHIPPVLFYKGDLDILKRETIAIIGSRNASADSLLFASTTACYLAEQGANVTSGNARGVDRAAYTGAVSSGAGHTTVILPQGIRTLSGAQMRALQPLIEAGQVLLLSQFHPDASWFAGRAMERNHLVTGLAQVMIVAESGSKGGTWEGATGALKRGWRVYVRQPCDDQSLSGNQLLLERGALPLLWPSDTFDDMLSSILQESRAIREKQQEQARLPDQMALLAWDTQYLALSPRSRRIIREISTDLYRLIDRTSRRVVRKRYVDT